MDKLLFVDDEPEVLEAMQSISWEDYHIQLCPGCVNGPEALAQMKRDPPDLIVTDVKMPVMNGIELIRQAREAGIGAEFIVLSGFDEFEFAKSAMSMGVRYYLLKPCGEEELIGVILKARQDLDNRRKISQTVDTYQKVKEELLRHCLIQVMDSERAAKELSLDTLLEPEEKLFLVVFSKVSQIPDPAGVCRAFQTLGQGDEAFGLTPSPIVVGDSLCALYLCRDGLPTLSHITELQNRLAETLGALPQHRMAAAVDILELRQALEHAFGKSRSYRYITPEGIFDRYKADHWQKNVDRTAITLEQLAVEHPKEAEQFLGELCQTEGRSLVLLAAVEVALKQNASSQLLFSFFNQMHENANDQEFAHFLVQSLAAPQKKQEKSFPEEIVAYIDAHLDDPRLSLKWVASELVFRNEDYVGKAFAAYTGETFQTYLNRKRIERAKFLISMLGEDKLYTVAEQIGLGHNPRYFSSFFRKQTGYSPKEYKRLYGKKEN